MHKLIFSTFIIPFLAMYGCTLDAEKVVDRSKFSFKTGDDTEIFFKNVRQSEYDLEVNVAAKFNVFRHEDRLQEDSIPWLNPAIVMNYLQDEAYILLEPTPAMAQFDVWEVILEKRQDTLRMSLPNRENNLEFASRIYEELKQGNPVMIYTGNDTVSFNSYPNASEAFRITLSDYYRLTRIY